jgi:hypothetical protein
METTPQRLVFIFCTVTYTTNGSVLRGSRPMVLSVQQMTLNQKVITNGYKWMMKAGFAWLSPEDFLSVYGDQAIPEMRRYSLRLANWLLGTR